MIVPYANPIPAELVNPSVSQLIHVRRRKGAWIGNGIWNDSEDGIDTITGRGIVYPATLDDLMALPEGERIRKSLMLFWPQRFEMNDRIEYDGEEYRVVHVDPWHRYGYNMAIAQVNQIHE